MESDNTSCPLGSEVRVLAFGIFHFSGSGVWGAKGEDFAGSGANGDSGFLKHHSVDGSIERRALNIVFELVLTALVRVLLLGGGSPQNVPK